ncbi:hypothetical protein Q7P37_005879 [Cladosporium fusiforme]
MHALILLLGLLPFLSTSRPTFLRAGGGPIPKTIPSNCTVTNALPHDANECDIGNINGWKPRSNFTSTHLLHSSYFDLPQSAEELWEQCSEECYGYGDEGECKSALLAQDVPTPEGYLGTPGGDLMTACLLFEKYISPNDFEKAQAGQWVNETAGGIYCGY